MLKQVYKQTQGDTHCYLVIVTVFMFHCQYWHNIIQNSTLLLNTYDYKQSKDVGHDTGATTINCIFLLPGLGQSNKNCLASATLGTLSCASCDKEKKKLACWCLYKPWGQAGGTCSPFLKIFVYGYSSIVLPQTYHTRNP